MTGKVYFVGAGPGDEKLITIKGMECIQKADLIVFDPVVNPRILKYAKAGAEFIDTGKFSDHHGLLQAEINRIIINKARSGKLIARVKGGDPFVFCRGGEEAEALSESGVEFEIIPGITAAVSVPAYAGIPVTYRDYCSSYHVITGYDQPGQSECPVNYRELAGLSGTLVILMEARKLPEICKNLIGFGRSPRTPVAVIEKGTTCRQRVICGQLLDIVRKTRDANMQSPVVTVIGEVVSLQKKLRWYPVGPLSGITILINGERDQAGLLIEKIEGLGGEAVLFPVTQIMPPEDWTHFEQVIQNVNRFNWLLFTDVHGVTAFFNRLKTRNIDIRHLHNIRLAAGEAAGAELNKLGFQVDFVLENLTGREGFEALRSRIKSGESLLMTGPCAAAAEIKKNLKAHHVRVEELIVYHTVIDGNSLAKIIQMLQNGGFDYITFTSASAVRNFVSIIGPERIGLANRYPIICIGPITEQEAYQSGLHVADVADKYTVDGLVEKLTGNPGRYRRIIGEPAKPKYGVHL